MRLLTFQPLSRVNPKPQRRRHKQTSRHQKQRRIEITRSLHDCSEQNGDKKAAHLPRKIHRTRHCTRIAFANIYARCKRNGEREVFQQNTDC